MTVTCNISLEQVTFHSCDHLRRHLHPKWDPTAARRDQPLSGRHSGAHGHKVEHRFGHVREEVQDVRRWSVWRDLIMSESPQIVRMLPCFSAEKESY